MPLSKDTEVHSPLLAVFEQLAQAAWQMEPLVHQNAGVCDQCNCDNSAGILGIGDGDQLEYGVCRAQM